MTRIMIFELTPNEIKIVHKYLIRSDVEIHEQNFIYDLTDRMTKFLQDLKNDK